MKVKVNFKISSKIGERAQTTFNVVAFAADTVSGLKNRITSVQDVPFPDQQLLLNGQVLEDERKLSECGVREGVSLDFVVHASETALLQQLSDLLPSRPVSAEELALLYTHRHGAPPTEALEMVGCRSSFLDFLGSHPKNFDVSGALVSPARAHATLLQISVQASTAVATSWCSLDDDLEQEDTQVQLAVQPGETVHALAGRAAAAAGLPSAFPELELFRDAASLPGDASAAAAAAGASSALRLRVGASEESLAKQLQAIVREQGELQLSELSLLYAARHGANPAAVLRTAAPTLRGGVPELLRRFPERFALRTGGVVCIPAGEVPAKVPPQMARTEHERLLALHDALCAAGDFRGEVARALGRAAAYLSQATFLNIRHVVAGGAAGKGTCIPGAASGEVTLFLEGLPANAQGLQLLGGLLDATAKGLRERIVDEPPPAELALRVLGVSGGAVQLEATGLTSLELRLSPAFRTHGEALQAVGALTEDAARASAGACLAEQEVRFVRKQPEAVKVTARLLKLWRARQQWSSAAARPGDRLLELLAIHAASQQRPNEAYDQAVVLGRVAALLRSFSSANVAWPAPLYGTLAVPDSLRTQRPLVMDPINPFVNLAADVAKHACELAERAAQGIDTVALGCP
eukprot:TRINITY_DN55657_c0_g1_i1.p1 TRINITY_DN55657_c0_g1~~TRINITY_DN55657_c0_g1_i1.p1  ORF type:complete len:638 (+),score=163.97 TRINITY_DN55657_c0_g1_i1:198-2111(+)